MGNGASPSEIPLGESIPQWVDEGFYEKNGGGRQMSEEGEAIAKKLLAEGLVKHASVLVLLNRFGILTLTDIRYALGSQRARAPYWYARGIMLQLKEWGLVEERVGGLLGKRRTIFYQLTPQGREVAKILENLLGFILP